MNRLACVSLWLVLLSGIASHTLDAADKHALLVGVTVYKHSRMNEQSLRYPEDDARAVAKLLQDSGYEVTLLLREKAMRSAIDAAMQSIAKSGATDGVLLLGFFGHGVQYGSDAYYCPFDAGVRDVKDADGKIMRDKSGTVTLEPDPATLVSMQAMLDTLTRSGAGNKILLADCCREDPSRARGLRGRAFGSSLRVDQLPKNCAALFACSEGERAFEHDEWNHGAFTKALLDECAGNNDVTANVLSVNLYRRVNTLVAAKSRSEKDKQSVANVMQGVVDLKLTPTAPKAFVNSIGMKMLPIPAGTFMMGSPTTEVNRGDDEKQHEVTIGRSFFLGETEVTQSQWITIMETKPWRGKSYVREGDNYPATYVSWTESVEFCERLSRKEGKTYSLPTEAQWEYACRGGDKRTIYSFGDNALGLKDYAWFWGNAKVRGEEYAHLVKQKRPNSFGMYDIHGNVGEWCSDWHDPKYYESSPSRDPIGPSTGSVRVLRGGGWGYDESVCRSANRYSGTPGNRDYDHGFRVALVPPR